MSGADADKQLHPGDHFGSEVTSVNFEGNRQVHVFSPCRLLAAETENARYLGWALQHPHLWDKRRVVEHAE